MVRRGVVPAVLWSAILFAFTGAALGLRYRAPVLVAGTAVAVVSSGLLGWHKGYAPGGIATLVLAASFALTVGYLVGLALRVALSR